MSLGFPLRFNEPLNKLNVSLTSLEPSTIDLGRIGHTFLPPTAAPPALGLARRMGSTTVGGLEMPVGPLVPRGESCSIRPSYPLGYIVATLPTLRLTDWALEQGRSHS